MLPLHVITSGGLSQDFEGSGQNRVTATNQVVIPILGRASLSGLTLQVKIPGLLTLEPTLSRVLNPPLVITAKNGVIQEIVCSMYFCNYN